MQYRFLSAFAAGLVLIFGLSVTTSAQRKTTRTSVNVPTNPAAKPTSPDLIREADGLFSHGEDAGRDRQSLQVLERALTTDGNNYQLLWRAARAYYFVGDDTNNKSEKVANFDKGVASAQRAVGLQPNAVEGHFWLGVNYGGQSEVKGVLNAITTVKKIRAEMETVLKLNAGYEDGSAYLALGRIDRELPRLLGGSPKRGLAYLEQGVRVAPKNMDLKLTLAEAYLDEGRKDEGRRLLQEIVNTPVNPARAKEGRHIQDRARQLLAK